MEILKNAPLTFQTSTTLIRLKFDDLNKFLLDYFTIPEGQGLIEKMKPGVLYQHRLSKSVLVNNPGILEEKLQSFPVSEIQAHSVIYLVKPFETGYYILVSINHGKWLIIPTRAVSKKFLDYLNRYLAKNIGFFSNETWPDYDIGAGVLEVVALSEDDIKNLKNRVRLEEPPEDLAASPRRPVATSNQMVEIG